MDRWCWVLYHVLYEVFFYLRSSWCSAFHAWHKPKRLCPPGIDLEGPFHPREGWRRHGERAASHAETHQEAYRDAEMLNGGLQGVGECQLHRLD